MLYTTEENRYGPGPPCTMDMAINSPAILKSSFVKANIELMGYPSKKSLKLQYSKIAENIYI